MDMKSVRKEHGPMERMLSMVGRKGALKVDGYHIGPDKVKAYEDYLIKWHRDPPKFKPQTEKRDREDAKGESSPEGKRGPRGPGKYSFVIVATGKEVEGSKNEVLDLLKEDLES